MQKETGTVHGSFEAGRVAEARQVTPDEAESVADFKVDELRKIAALMGLKFDAERLRRPEEGEAQVR